jgi:phage FluMu protein Com
MPIEFRCTTCGRLLRVADEHSGKLARCPNCQTELTVPATSTAGVAEISDQPPAAEDTERWYIQFGDGRREGPLSRLELDRKRESGQLTRQAQLLREGWEVWKWADEVFPALRETTLPAGSQSYFPQQPAGGTAWLRPHRGGMILSFGIISLVACTTVYCSPLAFGLSIPAWVMANADLRAMREGTMDPSGEGMTQAGRIMAILQIVLTALAIVGLIAFVSIAILVEELN